jgi:mono/diheme cytochrome c family protein
VSRRLAGAAFLVLLLASAPAARAADALGLKVFTQIAQPPCMACHTLKAAGASGTVGPSLDELKPDRDQVLNAVRTGVGIMPPFDDKLTAEQIDAVARFVAQAAGQ